MKKIRFRASRSGDLMTNPRKKSETLSETAKALIKDMFLEYEYGYREIIKTNPMDKGHLCEAMSRNLIQQVLGGEFRKENKTRSHNDLFSGMCDHKLQKVKIIEDVKNSWTLKTFMNADGKNAKYYAQGMTYLDLHGYDKFRLIYTLNPMPEQIFEKEKSKLLYMYDFDESNQDYIDHLNQVIHNNELIANLNLNDRVKVFEFDRDDNFINDMHNRALEGIEYYKTLKL